MDLAAKLGEFRQRSGQSLQQLADAVGASASYILDLEHGKIVDPSLELLRKLAAHFRTTVAHLIGETEEEVPEEFIRIYRDLDTLTEGERAVIQDVIEALKKRKAQAEGGV